MKCAKREKERRIFQTSYFWFCLHKTLFLSLSLFIWPGSASAKTADSNKEVLAAAFRPAFPLESKRKTEKSLQTFPSGPGGAYFLEFECLAKELMLIITSQCSQLPKPFPALSPEQEKECARLLLTVNSKLRSPHFFPFSSWTHTCLGQVHPQQLWNASFILVA